MTAKSVEVNIDDRVATVELNRPDSRNAFDRNMIELISDIFSKLSANTSVHAVVLLGKGEAFCAGADLEYMRSMAAFSLEENEKDARVLNQMFAIVRECAVPVIACVHGAVMGGGLGLTACADVVLAESQSKFCFSEVKLGLVPAVISPFVIERSAHALVKRWMLTGEVFSAQSGVTAGLVDMFGTQQEIDIYLNSLLMQMSANGPEAVRATKKLLRKQYNSASHFDTQEMTIQTIAARRVSAEGQEGLKSFLEKRKASWRPN
jgi:methylglutaconyl-CoA hydratase